MIDLSLGRVERLLARLDHPERRLPPVVHVAGTNGKGSLIALLEAMLEAAGYRVHAYTSPHLVRFAERIRLAGRAIDEDELAAVLAECERRNGEAQITFFEITTAAALLACAARPADVMLLETGLGGRFDATNVVARPLLSAITPVSMDHMHYLGDSVAAIAFEKAGIIKPGVTAVVGRQPAEAARVIAARAAELGAPLSSWGEHWRGQAAGAGMVYQARGEQLELPLPALPGGHQIDNAAQAIACLGAMTEFRVPPEAVRRGLGAVAWPARLQRLDGGVLARRLPPGSELWLDGAHNPGASAALAATLAAWAGRDREPRPLHLVVGMLNSKQPESFLEPLAAHAASVLGIAIPGESASLAAADIVAAAGAAGIAARPADGIAAALDAIAGAAGGSPPPRVLICGSLYLAGKVLAEEEAGALTRRGDTTRAPAA